MIVPMLHVNFVPSLSKHVTRNHHFPDGTGVGFTLTVILFKVYSYTPVLHNIFTTTHYYYMNILAAPWLASLQAEASQPCATSTNLHSSGSVPKTNSHSRNYSNKQYVLRPSCTPTSRNHPKSSHRFQALPRTISRVGFRWTPPAKRTERMPSSCSTATPAVTVGSLGGPISKTKMALWSLGLIRRYGGSQAPRHHHRHRQRRGSAGLKGRKMAFRHPIRNKRQKAASRTRDRLLIVLVFQSQRRIQRDAVPSPASNKDQINPVQNQRRERKRRAALTPARKRDPNAPAALKIRNQIRNQKRTVVSLAPTEKTTTPISRQTLGRNTASGPLHPASGSLQDPLIVSKVPRLQPIRSQKRKIVRTRHRHHHLPRNPATLTMLAMRYRKGSAGHTVPSLALAKGQVGSRVPVVQFQRDTGVPTLLSQCFGKTLTNLMRRTPRRRQRV
jgi:hypothetical protein